jgi:hypothetical protein
MVGCLERLGVARLNGTPNAGVTPRPGQLFYRSGEDAEDMPVQIQS